MGAELSDTYAPDNDKLRHCIIRGWSNYPTLGFTLKPTVEPPFIIQHVESISPAAAGGLRVRDVILAANGQNVFMISFDKLKNIIKNVRSSNDHIELLVMEERSYNTSQQYNRSINTKLAKIIETPSTMPNDYQSFPKHQPRTCNIHLSESNSSYGFGTVNPLTNVGMIVQEVYPNSSASNTSLRKCDRILEIDNQFVDNLPSRIITQKLRQAKLKHHVKLYVVDTETYEFFQSNNIPLQSKPYQQSLRANKSSTNLITDQDEVLIDDGLVSRPNIDNFQSHYQDDQDEFSIPTSTNNKILDSSVDVCKGDLITQRTDVIVICSTSKYLFNSICKAGGDSVLISYNAQLTKNSEASLIAVKAGGQLASKMIYFLPWKANSDESILCKSIENFVSDALEEAVKHNYRSIAFPAIGCGQFGCSISLVARAMVEEVYRQLNMHQISVSFVIQQDRTDIYDEFRHQINSLKSIQPSLSDKFRTIHATFEKGVIAVEMGDITKEKVLKKTNVIIGSSSSNILRKEILKAAGKESQTAYDTELKNHPNSVLMTITSGNLPCKQIFFVKWKPNNDEKILQQSLGDLISSVVQNAISHKFTSIAFPAIGCGAHGCSVDIVVKTMVIEMKKHLIERKLSWTVKFVVRRDQENVYDEFCQQVLTTDDGLQKPKIYHLPSTWEKLMEHKNRFILPINKAEYTSIVGSFAQSMKGKYKEIIKIERIQNVRWYMQYLAHKEDFEKRLCEDTEKRLYHGCPEQAANSIIEECFNRSFAGVNGIRYGLGVYFSSNATYSHGFTKTNTNEERCIFIARVLIGKTTKGDSSMKTRPLGFDSTTDGDHIFVTYHDAQAYAEYLITYK
ncbi:unnamed protein product [Rotaria sp. Silwood2]|nr:unnamed protein product [Rotaria sp. Silwood2]